MGRCDAETETLIPTTGAVFDAVTGFSSKDYGADASDDLSPTLRASGHDASHANGGRTPAVAYAIQERAVSENLENGPQGKGWQPERAYTLEARNTVQSVAFVQNSRDEIRLMGGDGQIVGALAAEAGAKQQCYVASVALRGRDGGGTAELGDDLAGCLRASGGGGNCTGPIAAAALNASERYDFDSETFVLEQPVTGFSSGDYGADATDNLSPTLRASGHDESHANGGRTPAVAYSVALRDRDGGATAEMGDDVACALRTGGGGDKPHVLAPNDVLPIDMRQASRGATMTNNRPEGTSGGAPGTGIGEWGDPATTVSASNPPAVCVTEPVTHTLKAEGFDASEDGTGRGQPITPTVCFQTRIARNGRGYEEEISPALNGADAGATSDMRPCVAGPQMAVRRLMPIECERLQGLPDNWTRIPVRRYAKRTITKTRPEHQWEPDADGKHWWLMAADGPRYKQLGNSMPVPVMRWIGSRIAWWLQNRDIIVDLVA